MKIGTNNLTNVKIGTTQVQKVMRGTNLVWENFINTLFIGGNFQYTVKGYRESDLSKYIESPSLGGDVRGIYADGDYVYAGNFATTTFYKLNRSDLSVNNSANISSTTWKVVGNSGENYIYISDYTGNLLKKINRNTLAVEAYVSVSGILNLYARGDYLYLASNATKTIQKRRKSDLGLVAESASYAYTPWSVYADDNYVWLGGTNPSLRLIRYNVNTLSSGSGSNPISSTPVNIRSDGTYIYLASATNTVAKVRISDSVLVGQTASVGYPTWNLSIKGNYIYVISSGANNKAYVFNKETLAYVDETDVYNSTTDSLLRGSIYLDGQEF